MHLDIVFDCQIPNFKIIFSMTIKMFFDQSFQLKHGSQSYNVLRRTLAHVQNYFFWPSLNTTFTFSAHYSDELLVNLAQYGAEESL